MVLLLPPLMLHGLPYHNSIIEIDLRSCRWMSGIKRLNLRWKIRGSCSRTITRTSHLRRSGTTCSHTLCKWVVNALDRQICVLTSCVGTLLKCQRSDLIPPGAPPPVSVQDTTASATAVLQPRAGCQKGGITSSVCGLTEDLIFLGFCGNNLLYRAR